MDYTCGRWIKLAAKAKRRDKYLCQKCLRFGRKSPAEIVHHIVPVEVDPAREYDLTNLQSLCRKCHNAAHPEKGGSPPSRNGQ